jgi:alkylhydroperoxidase family enzyme
MRPGRSRLPSDGIDGIVLFGCDPVTEPLLGRRPPDPQGAGGLVHHHPNAGRLLLVDWNEIPTDVDPRALLEPEAWSGFVALQRATWETAPAALLELCRERVAMLLRAPEEIGCRPDGVQALEADKARSLADWPSSPAFTDAERVALSFTEQFVMDVAGTTDADRERLAGHLPADQIGPFVMGLYVCDFGLRMDLVTVRLFPGALRSEPGSAAHGGTDPSSAFDEFLLATGRMRALDPVTAELARLRGARYHNCRICQSIRSVKAFGAGADEAMYQKLDGYESSDFSDRHKVAIRLVDALITQPAEITTKLVDQVHHEITPAEAVQIILSVARNSIQKVAVALAGDAPIVTEDFDYYDITDRGDVVYGQDAPVTA